MSAAGQLLLDVHNKLIVDLFAGGGGMSVAFETAFGRSPDIAINHSDDALSMHRANHPQTRHFIADVYEVCPRVATQGRPVGWLHLSPDCTHHSQASGGQPRNKKIRGLSWVGYRWAGQVSPDAISLENVTQILKWGPLIAKRDKMTGRVVKLDETIAMPGERVPVQQQYLIPDPKRSGQTWRKFVAALHRLGYVVEWRNLCAADFGGHTTRERLFMLARRDGLPICWPEPTYFKKPQNGQKKWKAAAECIDFSIPCPSIFERARPLAEATNRRIAKGIKRYVLESAKPFIVPITHQGGDRIHGIDDPLRTVTTAHRGEFALSTPVLAKFRGNSIGHSMADPLPTITSGGDCARPAGAAHALGLIAPTLVQAAHGDGKPGGAKRWGSGAMDIGEPIGTITASGGHAIAAATLVQSGYGEREGQSPRALDIEAPLGTVVGTVKHAVSTATTENRIGFVSAFLSRQFGASIGHDAEEPMATTMAGGGGKSALVECHLSEKDEAGALRVAGFLMRYYGEGGQWGDLDNPMSTITTKDRLALVTVHIAGTPYVIVDIGLRMLQPSELFLGQDFPESYTINRGHDGRVFSKSTQVRLCGNSVNPVPASAFLIANAPWLAVRRVA